MNSMGMRGYRADWVFSAESICDVLKVDLAALRAQLRRQAVGHNTAQRMYRVPTVYKRRPTAGIAERVTCP
jgi:hypothetical protein